MNANAANAPMTIPAIAPPLSPFDAELSVATPVGAADAMLDAEVCEVTDAPDDVAGPLELTTLDEIAPRICASTIGLVFESPLQQSVLSPQHHLVLFFVPSHGVILAVSSSSPVEHTLAHFVASSFCPFSVQ